MAFKALAYQDRLEEKGVPREQARAHALALEELVVDEQVTKDDLESVSASVQALGKDLRAEAALSRQQLDAKIEGVEQRLDAKIDQLDARIGQRMAELKFEMIRWITGTIVGAVITLIVAMWRFAR